MLEAEHSSEPPWQETCPIHVTRPAEAGTCQSWRCGCRGMP